MPCYFPLQAQFSIREDGKKDIRFSKSDWFKLGLKHSSNMLLPCGRCMGCRVESSRQWAIRCMHEAKMHKDNCFVTLTYAPEFLPEGGTLKRKDVQDFMMRLRRKFNDRRIRVFYCGEYGDNLHRPHYHLALFGFVPEDKVVWNIVNCNKYYTSNTLDDLWPKGFALVSELTFNSAAYIARYCTKKITGPDAKKHYGDKEPEFAGMSRRPGIGRSWFDKYAKSDVLPHDNVVVRGAKSKLPRYYDKIWEQELPLHFKKVKDARIERALLKEDDNTHDRLGVKLKCAKARWRLLVRKLEKQEC